MPRQRCVLLVRRTLEQRGEALAVEPEQLHSTEVRGVVLVEYGDGIRVRDATRCRTRAARRCDTSKFNDTCTITRHWYCYELW